jgi:hypothetical protein
MSSNLFDFKKAIQDSGKSIYDRLPLTHPLYIPTDILESLLNKGLKGKSLAGLPLRTRSKVVKSLVCEAIGYPIPDSFIKTQPRFLGQNFDTYVQKTSNLQIWNEEISAARRYVVIGVNEADVITKVKIIVGNQLAFYDKTGTITKKYQARFIDGNGENSKLVVSNDTLRLTPFIKGGAAKNFNHSPSAAPSEETLLSIEEIFNRLKTLIGTRFSNPGASKERTRGVELQKLVCTNLGYSKYEDTGQFPDVFNQILEVKLQTSPTIDLGLILPSSEEELYTGNDKFSSLQHKDARYAVFYGELEGDFVRLTQLVVVTGEAFFSRFQRFEGKVINGKIQLRLPNDFYDL